MPLNTFTPATAPDVGLSASNKFRILKSTFGDGYNQRAGDGINTKEKKYTLSWNNLEVSEINAIISFLDGQAGYIAFNYTLPGDSSSQKFICEDYSETWQNGNLKGVTATFELVFDL